MSAVISECGRYRYRLDRVGDLFAINKPVVFIMLNPSTADAKLDDPTIRRCKGFAKRWNCKGLIVVNLYAYRATKPVELWIQEDPVGPCNDFFILKAIEKASMVVCAWGVNAKRQRVDEVVNLINLISPEISLKCLGTTKNGHPRHPLYVKNDVTLTEWSFP